MLITARTVIIALASIAIAACIMYIGYTADQPPATAMALPVLKQVSVGDAVDGSDALYDASDTVVQSILGILED